MSKTTPEFSLSPEKLDRICTTVEQIENHLDQPVSLERLSQIAYMSKFHFLRTFQLATGLCPIHYQKTRQLTQAALNFRNTLESVEKIAFGLGFDDHSSFSRAFKRQFGLSPSQYRKSSDPLWNLHLPSLTEEVIEHWNTGGIYALKNEDLLEEFELFGLNFDSDYQGDFHPLYQQLAQILSQMDLDIEHQELWLYQEWGEREQIQLSNHYFLGIRSASPLISIALAHKHIPKAKVISFEHWGARRSLLHHSFRFIFGRFDPRLAQIKNGWMATRIFNGNLSQSRFFVHAKIHLAHTTATLEPSKNEQ